MEKRIVCIVSLVTGIGLGSLLTKALNEGDIPNSVTGEPHSQQVPSEDAASDPGIEIGTGGSKQKIDDLLALVNPSNVVNNHELYAKTNQLDLASVVRLIADLEKLPSIDYRTSYQVRSALLVRLAKLDPDAAWLAATGIKRSSLRGASINTVLGEIALTDFPKAYQLIDSMKDGRTKRSAINGIIATASRSHPELVFDMIDQIHQNWSGWPFYNLFQHWASSQPDAAISKLNDIESRLNRQEALKGLLSGLAATDPDQAIAIAEGLENSMERAEALSTAAHSIAATNPQRALEMLNDMPVGYHRLRTIGSIASSWANADPKSAVEWIQTLSPSERTAAVRNSFNDILMKNPQAAAVMIETLPMSKNNFYLFDNLAREWAQHDVDGVEAWIETLPENAARQTAIKGLINTLQSDNPARTAELLSSEGITTDNSDEAGAVFGNWVTTDPIAAKNWLNGLELKDETIQNFSSSAIDIWALNNAEEAADYAFKISDESIRKEAINPLMRRWSQSDPGGAKDWVLSNLEGEMKSESLSSLIQHVATRDHRLALELFAESTEQLTDGEIAHDFADIPDRIAKTWAYHDGVGAAEWVMDLPESDQRSSAIRTVVSQWSQNDTVAASEFVSTLPQGSERDGAVETLVDQVQQNDPESAFIWAESITDEQKRSNVVRNAAMQWKEIDADAAFQAVGNADIPDEAKVQLLKQLQE